MTDTLTTKSPSLEEKMDRLEKGIVKLREDSMRQHEEVLTKVSSEHNDFSAKIDNMDRTVQVLDHNLVAATASQTAVLKLLGETLQHEREEKQQLRGEDRQDLLEDKKHRYEKAAAKEAMWKSAVKAVWDKGGQWIVAAVAFYVVYKLTGIDDLSGLKVLLGK